MATPISAWCSITDSGLGEGGEGPISQDSVIDHVHKLYKPVWGHMIGWRKVAERYGSIGKGLKVMAAEILDPNILDGGASSMDYPGELLMPEILERPTADRSSDQGSGFYRAPEILRVSGEPLELHAAIICPSRESTVKLLLSALDEKKTFVGGDGEIEPGWKILRACNWSAEETCTMLELIEEALSVDDVPLWKYVSENLWEKFRFDRAPKSCENMWDALRHSYKASQADESKIRACTYLDLECREVFERILASKSFEEKTRSIQIDADFPSGLPFCQFRSSGSEVEVLHDDSWSTGRLNDNMGLFGVGDEVLRDDLKDDTCSSEYQGLSGDTTGTVESHAEVTVDSHVSRITETYYETNANYAGRKRSAATAMEDELITRMAPFVNKQIEDALRPLISVLRRGEEDEQKYRQKLLVLEEEKLALKRQRMLFEYRTQL